MTEKVAPRPILGDMPWNIKEKIYNCAGPVTRYSLRFCTKEFRRAANSNSNAISNWSVNIMRYNDRFLPCNPNPNFPNYDSIRFVQDDEDLELKFIPCGENGCRVEMTARHEEERDSAVNRVQRRNVGVATLGERYELRIVRRRPIWVRFIKERIIRRTQVVFESGPTYKERAMAEFAKMFRCSRISFKHLQVSTYEREDVLLFRQVGELLKNQSDVVRTIGLEMYAENATQEDVMLILPYLKPGALKNIKFCFLTEIPYDQIVALRQWQLAETFEHRYVSNIPIDSLTHFKKLAVKLQTFSQEDAIKMILAARRHEYQFVEYDISALESEHAAIGELLEAVPDFLAPHSIEIVPLISFENTPLVLQMEFDWDRGRHRAYILKPWPYPHDDQARLFDETL